MASTVRADGTGAHQHQRHSPISTPSLERRAKQFGGIVSCVNIIWNVYIYIYIYNEFLTLFQTWISYS